MICNIINRSIVMYVIYIRRERCINILAMIHARREVNR